MHFGTLDAVFAADDETLTEIPDVGAITAANIRAWYARPTNQQMIEQLRQAGSILKIRRSLWTSPSPG